ncbi:MAG: tRNA lysidine(34) synthetase TilS [Gammaproteobacteria bacterium]|nr:tRNA lysidine(34) synthetase TilS [Gammaproteobacteria bacterium]
MRRFDADALWRVLRDEFGLVGDGDDGDAAAAGAGGTEVAGGTEAAGVETTAAETTTAKLALAYSGGRDSTVLLHALAGLRARHEFRVRALHFDHGLAAESAQWAAQCAAQCREWGVEFATARAESGQPPGESVEAHARRCRYRWFAQAVAPGEVLLTAHHADDQAETVLLNLLRGRGPESLAGIAPRRKLPAAQAARTAQVARPLLGFSGDSLADYARAHGLRWLDDPSNDSPQFDRNYLRAAVMPVLRRRWPGAAAALSVSAAHCRAAAELLAEEDARRLEDCRADAMRGVFCLAPPLSVEAARGLERARIIRLLRHWIHRCGHRSPSAGQLGALFAQVFAAQNRRATAALRWDGVEIRCFRGHLYLIAPPGFPGDSRPAPVDWDLQPHDFGNGLRVAVETVGDGGGAGVDGGVAAIDPRRLRGKQVQWTWRCGGERMRLPGRAHRHKLKKLFQRVEMPPWERRALPLLTVDGGVAWAHRIGAAADYACDKPAPGIIPRFTFAGRD